MTIVRELIFFSIIGLLPSALLASLSVASVLWLSTHHPGGISTTGWNALSNLIGDVGTSSDFSIWVIVSALKAAGIPAEGYLSIAVSLTMDLMILFVSVLAWAAANQIIAGFAVLIAFLGFYMATKANADLAETAAASYAQISVAISIIGVGTALADAATA